MKTRIRFGVVAISLILFLMGGISAMAGPGDIDPTFVVGDGFTSLGGNGAVNAVAIQADGKILAGGTFKAYKGSSALWITRLLANGDLDTDFVTAQGTGLDSEVNDILILPDNKILICGDFLNDNGTSVKGIARLNADGSLDTSFPAGGSGIGGSSLRYGYSMVRQPDGKIILGGGFTSYNGVARNSIVRLNADGSLDTTFNPGTGPFTQAQYFTSYGVVDHVDLQPDGKIVVTGAFTSWNGVDVPQIVRLNSDGSVDSTFNPHFISEYRISSCLVLQDGKILLGGLIGDESSTKYLMRLHADGTVDTTFTADTDGSVITTDQLYDGKLLVGGIYKHYAGSVRGSLTRADNGGSIDSTFVTTPHTLGNDYITHVYDTAIQTDGKIIVSGWFTNFNGQAYNNIVRLDGDVLNGAGNIRFSTSAYSVDENGGTITITVLREGGSDGAVQVGVGTANFEAEMGLDYTFFSGTIDWAAGEFGPKTFTVDILPDALNEGDEDLLLGVTVLSGSAVVNIGDGGATLTIRDDDAEVTITEQPRDQTVFVTQDATFNVRVSSVGPVTYQWYKGVSALPGATGSSYTESNTQIGDLGEYFVVVNNGNGAVTSTVAVLTVLEPAGSLDASWAAEGSGPSSYVEALALQPDGKLVIGGSFNRFNSINRGYICRMNADGTLDGGIGVNGFNQSVYAVSVRTNGNILAAGSFNYLNGTYRPRVAQMLSTGAFDTSWTGGTAQANAYSIAIQPDGKSLVGYSSSRGVRRYNVDGSDDAGWANVVPLGYVNGLSVQPDGKVIVAGYTYQYPVNTAGLYRLNADGTFDPTFNQQVVAGGQILQGSFDVQADGKIVVGYSLGSQSKVVRYHADGSLDSSFESVIFNQSMFRVLATPDGKVVVVGTFTEVDGESVGRMVRLNSDGRVDSSFFAGSGAPSTIKDVVQAPDGSLYVGGGFTTFNGITRRYVAKLNGGPGSIQFISPEFLVVEEDGSIEVSVERLSGSEGAVSAEFLLTPGSASTSDYTSVVGSVSWADGEMGIKTFTVPITSDIDAEADETIFLSLKHLTGGVSLGGKASAVLTIQDDDSPPVIVEQPMSINMPEDVSAEFEVGATSPYPIAYQWKFNGADLPGETNETYSIASVQTNYAGTYSVRLTNTNGFRDSDVVSLEVYPSPTRVDPLFSSLLNGAVRAVLPLGDGRTLVGGNFTSPRNKVALLNPDGTVDASFAAEVSGSGVVHVFDRDPQGRILVGGEFSQFGGVAHTNLVRLNRDFSIDSNFSRNLGDGPDGLVRDIAVLPSGSILVGGDFDSVSCRLGTTFLGKLDSTGLVDTNFISRAHHNVHRIVPHGYDNAYIAGSFFSYEGSNHDYLVRILPDGKRDTSFRADLNNAAYALALQDDGNLIVGGLFSERILRVSDTGDTDDSFAATLSVNDSVLDLAIQPNQRIIAVGSFTTFGTPHNRFARLNHDGSLDETISIGSGFMSSDVLCTAMEPDGGIWVGGQFTEYKGGSVNYLTYLHGDEVPLAIAIQPLDAAVVAGASAQFDVVAAGDTPFGYQWYENDLMIPGATSASISTTNAGTYYAVISNSSGSVTSRVATLEILGLPTFIQQPIGGYVRIGDSFSLVGAAEGAPAVSYRWQLNGSDEGTGDQFTVGSASLADSGSYRLIAENGMGTITSLVAEVIVHDPPTDMSSNFPALAGTPSFNEILDILPLPDQRLMVAGSFFQMRDGTDMAVWRYYLGLFNSDGSMDSYDGLFNNTVLDIARQRDGKILVAGAFTSSLGQTTNKYLIRLNADLTYDAEFSANLGTGPDNQVYDIELQADGRILISGYFSAVNGMAGTRSIARLRSDGRVDPSFTSEVVNSSSIIQVKQQLDGKLLICGYPFTYGTVNSAMHRLHPDGSRDSSFAVNFDVNPVEMIPLDDGRILVGGGFNTANGMSRKSLIRLESNGALDEDYLSGIEINGFVTALEMQPDGRLLAGGNFTIFDTARNYIVRINPDGTIDESFTAHRGFEGYDQRVYDIAMAADGQIWVSGSFETYDGVPVNNFVLLQGNAIPLAFASQPFDVIADDGNSVTFSAVAVGDPTITYQWFNGTNAILGAISNVLEWAAVTVLDNGSYSLQISNGSGSLMSLPAVLIVRDAPVIVAQPMGGVYTTDDAFDLAVEAIGVGPLTYQWMKEGSVLVGATNALLSFSTPLEADAGDYSVVVSGAIAPAATSLVAQIEIILPPGGLFAGFPPKAGVGNYQIVKEILPMADGRILIGGSFTTAGSNGNNTVVGNIALLNTNGTVDTSFMPNFSSEVSTVDRDASGAFIIGGLFSGATPADGPLVRCFTNGTFDATFTSNLGTGIRTPYGIGRVADVRVLSSGKILIAGTFSTINGHSSPGVARLNADGTVDTTFSSGMEQYSQGFQIILLPSGKMYVAGYLRNYSGYGKGIRLIDENGGINSSFTCAADNELYTMALLSDGRIVAGNGTYLVEGVSSSLNMAIMNADGSVDMSFDSASPVDFAVQSLALTQDGQILAGSTQYNNYRMIRLNGDGTEDSTFNTGVGANGTIYRIRVMDDGKIWVGGGFTTFNGQTVNGLVLLNGTPPVPSTGVSYSTWATSNGLTVGVNDGPEDDADGDGLKNIHEFAFGSHPNQLADAAWPAQAIVDVGGTQYLSVVFTRKRDVAGVSIAVEGIDGLVAGNSIATTVVSISDLGGGLEEVTVRLATSVADLPSAFLVVNVVYP